MDSDKPGDMGRLHFTDFLYGVVVGASFQNFNVPDALGLSDAILFISILVIADDWMAYQRRYSALGDKLKELPWDLFFGILVLTCWYLASRSGAVALNPGRAFVGLLALFYLFTGLAELPTWLRKGQESELAQSLAISRVQTDLAMAAFLITSWTVMMAMGCQPTNWELAILVMFLVAGRFVYWTRSRLV